MGVIGPVLLGWLIISMGIGGLFYHVVSGDRGWAEGLVAGLVAFACLAGTGIMLSGFFGG